jgi:hypothetical protein
VIHDGGSMAEVQLFGLLLIVMRCHQGSRRLMFSAIELGQLFFRFICFPRRTAADRKIPVICEYGPIIFTGTCYFRSVFCWCQSLLSRDREGCFHSLLALIAREDVNKF